MSLLRWPRRSLLYVKVAVGVISTNTSITEAAFVWVMETVDIIPPALTLRYFCACSAHCLCGDDTWGVAPGFILLRLQRALIAEVLAQVQEHLSHKRQPFPRLAWGYAPHIRVIAGNEKTDL